ncbi:17968_t:CDS:2, partial [Cetraspora pellucida]
MKLKHSKNLGGYVSNPFVCINIRDPREVDDVTGPTGIYSVDITSVGDVDRFYGTVELTDFDFISTNVNVVQNVQGGISSVASDNRSDIDLIAEDVESTTSLALKRSRVTTLRSSKEGIGSPTVINESATSFPTSVASVNTTSETVQVQKGKKKLSDLALSCLEPIVTDDARDEDVYAEDVSGDNDDLEIL